jgi:Multicopper oxidase
MKCWHIPFLSLAALSLAAPQSAVAKRDIVTSVVYSTSTARTTSTECNLGRCTPKVKTITTVVPVATITEAVSYSTIFKTEEVFTTTKKCILFNIICLPIIELAKTTVPVSTVVQVLSTVTPAKTTPSIHSSSSTTSPTSGTTTIAPTTIKTTALISTTTTTTTPSSTATVCAGNTAEDRSIWCNYSIDTDYYNEVPVTGVTREYWWVLEDLTMAPDGVPRAVMAVNGSIPGPTIIADWGDEVVIHVTNNLQTSKNGTSIHFHGLRQNYTNQMDGVTSVTQCPTPPGSTYTYKWRAEQYGSSW